MPTMTSPADTEVRWLMYRIDKGMFSDELAVTYPAEGEKQKSVFVSTSTCRAADSPDCSGRCPRAK